MIIESRFSKFGKIFLITIFWSVSGGLTCGCDGLSSNPDLDLSQPNNTLFFDGINDIAVLQHPGENLNAIRNEMTIQCWLRPDSISQKFAYILDRTDSSNAFPNGDRFQLALSKADRAVRFNINSIGLIGPILDLQKWYNLAVVFDGVVMSVYLDGNYVAGVEAKMMVDVTTSALLLGNDVSLSRPFRGYLDDLSIWNKALDASEIVANMTDSLSYPQAGLISYYPMYSSGDTVLVDQVGGNHMMFGFGPESDENDPKIKTISRFVSM